jgi:hypothetical protein
MTPSHPDGRSSWTTSRRINTERKQGKFRKDVKPMKWSYLLNPPVAVGRVSLLAGYVAGRDLFGIRHFLRTHHESGELSSG